MRDFEVHPSTFSEVTGGYLKDMRRMLRSFDARVAALHPFYSLLESAMFFSDYNERRFADGMEIYRQYFHAAAVLGAPYLVFHGGSTVGKSRCVVSDDAYIERYHTLYECGRSFGVTLLHENVYTHKAQNPDFCRKMIDYLGDAALFTFDNKQARRAGYDSVAFAGALAGHIRHIHISDCDREHDCLLPGQGQEDFAAMRRVMREADADALWTLEVYCDAFASAEELTDSMRRLEETLDV